MSGTKVKLCGLRSPADIEIANRFLPEYCGFVFAWHSKRYVQPELAAKLRRALDPRVTAVGVFVGEPVEAVARLLETGVIGAAQLHGGESEDYITALRELSGKPIIKVFRVRSADDIARAAECSADYVLLDGSAGGEGVAFDWELARGLRRDFFLAGGLDPGNVADSVAAANPFAVDVSSGVETGGGKDADKIQKFMKAVRGI